MTTRTADAFFWSYRYGARYCVVILDRSRREWMCNDAGDRVWRHWAREYHAATIGDLRRKAAPWKLPRNTGRLCHASVQ